MFWLGVLFAMGVLIPCLVPLGLWLNQRRLDEEEIERLKKLPSVFKNFTCCNLPSMGPQVKTHPFIDFSKILRLVAFVDDFSNSQIYKGSINKLETGSIAVDANFTVVPMIIKVAPNRDSSYTVSVGLVNVGLRACPERPFHISIPEIGYDEKFSAGTVILQGTVIDISTTLVGGEFKRTECPNSVHVPFAIKLSMFAARRTYDGMAHNNAGFIVLSGSDGLTYKNTDNGLKFYGNTNPTDGCIVRVKDAGYVPMQAGLRAMKGLNDWLLDRAKEQEACPICGKMSLHSSPVDHLRVNCVDPKFVSPTTHPFNKTVVMVVGPTRKGKTTFVNRVSNTPSPGRHGNISDTYGAYGVSGRGIFEGVTFIDTIGFCDTRWPKAYSAWTLINSLQPYRPHLPGVVQLITVLSTSDIQNDEWREEWNLLGVTNPLFIINVKSLEDALVALNLLETRPLEGSVLVLNLLLCPMADLYKVVREGMFTSLIIPQVEQPFDHPWVKPFVGGMVLELLADLQSASKDGKLPPSLIELMDKHLIPIRRNIPNFDDVYSLYTQLTSLIDLGTMLPSEPDSEGPLTDGSTPRPLSPADPSPRYTFVEESYRSIDSSPELGGDGQQLPTIQTTDIARSVVVDKDEGEHGLVVFKNLTQFVMKIFMSSKGQVCAGFSDGSVYRSGVPNLMVRRFNDFKLGQGRKLRVSFLDPTSPGVNIILKTPGENLSPFDANTLIVTVRQNVGPEAQTNLIIDNRVRCGIIAKSLFGKLHIKLVNPGAGDLGLNIDEIAADVPETVVPAMSRVSIVHTSAKTIIIEE